jgi:hypothetical protein
MEREYKKLLALPLCALLGISALSACSAANTSQEDETETIADTQEETSAEEPLALYFIDYADEEEDAITLNLKVYLAEGTFSPDFDADMIAFGNDLAGAYGIKVNDINEDKNIAQIWLCLDKSDLDLENLDLNASLTLKAGAVKNEDGQDMQELVFEQDLIYGSDTKSSSPVSAQYLPDSKTLVYRFEGDVTGVSTLNVYDNVMDSYLHSGNMHQLISYFILDFTNATQTNDTANVLAALTLTLRQQYNMYVSILNGANTGEYTYHSLKNRKSTYGDDRIQYLAGDTSSINFTSSSLYEDIQNLLSAGTLKAD